MPVPIVRMDAMPSNRKWMLANHGRRRAAALVCRDRCDGLILRRGRVATIVAWHCLTFPKAMLTLLGLHSNGPPAQLHDVRALGRRRQQPG